MWGVLWEPAWAPGPSRPPPSPAWPKPPAHPSPPTPRPPPAGASGPPRAATGACPRQANGHDCGVYVLTVAEAVLAAGPGDEAGWRAVEVGLAEGVTPASVAGVRARLRREAEAAVAERRAARGGG